MPFCPLSHSSYTLPRYPASEGGLLSPLASEPFQALEQEWRGVSWAQLLVPGEACVLLLSHHKVWPLLPTALTWIM